MNFQLISLVVVTALTAHQLACLKVPTTFDDILAQAARPGEIMPQTLANVWDESTLLQDLFHNATQRYKSADHPPIPDWAADRNLIEFCFYHTAEWQHEAANYDRHYEHYLLYESNASLIYPGTLHPCAILTTPKDDLDYNLALATGISLERLVMLHMAYQDFAKSQPKDKKVIVNCYRYWYRKQFIDHVACVGISWGWVPCQYVPKPYLMRYAKRKAVFRKLVFCDTDAIANKTEDCTKLKAWTLPVPDVEASVLSWVYGFHPNDPWLDKVKK